MKRILTLVLSLCLLFTAFPAMAEDLGGTWYFLMLGMTAGTLELNADGTASLQITTDGSEATEEGTWTAEESALTLTIRDQVLVLSYDGTALKLDASALEAMGVSAEGMGMSESMMDALLQVSREPGKITLGEFSAFSSDGTVPEGRTQEEMEAIQAEMLTAVFGMMGGLGGAMSDLSSAVSDLGSAAEEGPELTVLEENFYVRKIWDDQLEGIYIAKVQNQNDVPLYISEGSIILKDAEGQEAGKADYLSRCGSRYLEPGEISFICLRADAEGGTPTDYEAVLRTTGSYYSTDGQLEVTNPELRKTENYGWTNYTVAATLTNTGDAPLSQANVVMAVRDADGHLMDLAQGSLYQNELAAGSTITLLDTLDSSTVDYCTENGMELSSVEAFGWVGNYN
ncbi:MAG: FxLYD domain-containing protein [Clostridia bacterium]|nr:FxLYD domain-containing protein [Clostridia bacterium]